MNNKGPTSSEQTEPLGQVVCFVSAKGGTGKTVLSASTAYAMMQSGMRVVTIDTDFSTRGLSLFLLGSVFESEEHPIQSKHCLSDAILDELDIDDVTPMRIVRGSVEYNVLLSNKELWREGVPEERFLGGSYERGKAVTPAIYFDYLKKLCDRFRKEYDYIIIDTRGGYDFSSAAPATIADGYVVVIEADPVSIEQVSGLKKKMTDYAEQVGESSLHAYIKGFIVNKAIFSVDDRIFPEELARKYNSKTFGVIPIDKDAIRSYQKKSVPQEKFPDSDFSYHSLRAIERIVSPAANWPSSERTRSFYKFLSSVRSAWKVRRRIEFLQRSVIPSVLILSASIAVLFYFVFKEGTTRAALPVFYVTSILFVLFSIVGAMFSSLSLMAEHEARKSVRYSIAGIFLAALIGLTYLTSFDIPRTFSQDPLLTRVRERDQTIASQNDQIDSLRKQVSDLTAEEQFVKTDRAQLQQSFTDAQNQISDMQNQISTLKAQLSSTKRDRDSSQLDLTNKLQQIASLQQQLDDCLRRLKTQGRPN